MHRSAVVYSAFSKQAFARALRAGDSDRFDIDLKAEKDTQVALAIQCAEDPSGLANFNDICVGGKPCVCYSDYPTTLVLRALASHVQHRTRIKMPNRDSIVRGVVQVLSDATPMAVFRRDLTSFYESIPLAPLKGALLENALLGPTATKVLEKFFEVHCGESTRGVPRGLSLSAVLAELALQEFDREIRTHASIHRYFRFSDDLFIVSFDLSFDVDALITRALPDGLRLNPRKRQTARLSNEEAARCLTVEYLGYAFNILSISGNTKAKRPISVTIADKKIKKLKSRVILTLKAFSKDHNSALLLDRLRFLSSNFGVPRAGMSAFRKRKRIRAGIFFNYHLCHNSAHDALPRFQDGLKGVDGFLQSLLFSSNSEFSASVASHCPPAIQAKLKALSFSRGFEVPMMARFPLPHMHEIKSAWLHAA